MTRPEVQGWLDRYLEAWRQGDPEQIGALFTDDAVYRYRPHPGGRTLEGNPAIVEGWLDHSDDLDDWEASYAVFAADEGRAVAVGTTRYLGADPEPDDVYHNCFLLRFAPDGRCSDFTEFWMLEPKDG